MEISGYTLAIWFVSALIGSLGILIFTSERNRSSSAFLSTVIFVMLWTAGVGYFISAPDVSVATKLVKLCYLSGTAIAISFLFFSFVYPDNRRTPPFLLEACGALFLISGYLYLFTDRVIAQAFPVGGIVTYGWQLGDLWYVFYALFYPFFLAGFYAMFRRAGRAQTRVEKRNIYFMFWGVLFLITPPTFTNIILPQFGYFSLIWLGPLLSIGWLALIAYSIIRYRQMNIKVFAIQFLVIAALLVSFANIFVDFTGSEWVPVGFFAVMLVLGYFIVKSTLREVAQRLELKELNGKLGAFNEHLQEKVDEQTKELKRLYEVERKARAEVEKLDEMKSQFIMIAQHHLRTPLTAIKWYIESIKRGEYGSVAPQAGEALRGLSGATERLERIVREFLDIAELRAGKSALTKTPSDAKALVQDVLDELREDIARAKLTVTLDAEAWPGVPLDPAKIREVFFVLLDNAVKYNNDGGDIAIRGKGAGGTLSITFENSGIGILEADREKLFKRLFERSVAAKAKNSTGMGIGLALAHAVVTAHGGTISLDSKVNGPSARITVTVTLPL